MPCSRQSQGRGDGREVMAVSPSYKPEISFSKDGTIFLPIACWKTIRDRFTADERAKLNGAVVSQVLCPEAAILDSYALGPDLTKRLREATAERAVGS